MKNKRIIAGILMLSFWTGEALAALTLDMSRYIYKGDSQFVSALVKNTSDREFGAQVWVDNITEDDTRPTFIATPSFFRIKEDGRQVFRVMKVSDHMPKDKESIYWLNLQEIPPAQPGGGLSMAIRTKVKLIYRPADIAENRDGAEKKMTVEYLPGEHWLVNTTPYIFAIGALLDDKDKPIEMSQNDKNKLTMFMPGDRVNVTGSNLKYITALNDYGNVETYALEGRK